MATSLRFQSLVFFAAAAFAQSQQTAKPVFTEATIKPTTADDFLMTETKFLPGGRVVAKNYPLHMLIGDAYQLSYLSRISGVEDWVHSERWDLEARADSLPAGLSAQEKVALMRQMMQNFLAEHFKLKIHRVTEDGPVYFMTAAPDGVKLPKANVTEEGCFAHNADDAAIPCHVILGGQGRGLNAEAVNMSDIAIKLENFTDRAIVNKTDIPGLFQLETPGWPALRRQSSSLRAKPEAEQQPAPERPGLFSIFGQFGIKFEPGQAQVEKIVIDHAEMPKDKPSGN